MPENIKLGCAAGSANDAKWGVAKEMINRTDVEYIGMDYLAELWMQQLSQQNYVVEEFVDHLREFVDDLIDSNVTLITNAGGLNPERSAKAILEELGEKDLRIASISGESGDYMLSKLPDLREQGVEFSNMDTGEGFEKIEDDVVNMVTYIGAFPIAEALSEDVDIVLAGRCTDSALYVGPMIYEFGWQRDDVDELARGVIAGHILECGPHATGGHYEYGWRDIDYEDMGYPLAKVSSNGEFVLTKHNTGGELNLRTVKEQLLYEIHDPTKYLTPDVVADFTTISVEETGDQEVTVTGGTGKPRPDTLKTGILYEDGYKAETSTLYSWPDALGKAQKHSQFVNQECDQSGLEQVRTEFLGYNGSHVPNVKPTDLPEVIVRFAAKSDDPDALRKFISKTHLNLRAPGTEHNTHFSNYEPEPIISWWPCLIPRDAVELDINFHTPKGVEH